MIQSIVLSASDIWTRINVDSDHDQQHNGQHNGQLLSLQGTAAWMCSDSGSAARATRIDHGPLVLDYYYDVRL